MNKNLVGSLNLEALKFKKGELVREVEDLCGENLFGCYQCGTCSAGCPFIEDMDIAPDEVIRYVVLDKKEVLHSKTIWLCASCYTCAERCPRDLNITKIMEALRQIILRKNIDKTDLVKISKEEKKSIPQLAFVSLFRKNVG
ncbi:MAG: 4Fe-4S dicluster domain-containing protein [Methanobacteriota archaeon]